MNASGASVRTAVVCGATGAVGSGIAYALLASGWRVHAIGRDQSKLDELGNNRPKLNKDRLHCHLQTNFNVSEMDRIRANVIAISPRLQLVVASLGGWVQGLRLIDVSAAQWSSVMQNNLDSHWLCAKQWLPALEHNEKSAYVLINGGAALAPVHGAGPVSVAAVAQLGLKAALATEAYPKGPRVYAVLANTPVITRSRPQGLPSWIGTDDIAQACVDCFDDIGAVKHGATLIVGEKINGVPTRIWHS
jgi:NAD(P)-dependent dehydrogenase (short-subunit alcohol dehydrogenase family)